MTGVRLLGPITGSGPKLLEDRRVLDLAVAGEEKRLGDDLGSLGVVIGEGQEQSATVL